LYDGVDLTASERIADRVPKGRRGEESDGIVPDADSFGKKMHYEASIVEEVCGCRLV